MNTQQVSPDFDKMVWKCPCCSQDRTDKYIKIIQHDVSGLFGSKTGTIIVNCKYCADMPGCKDKAFDRGWVINHFFKGFVEDVNQT